MLAGSSPLSKFLSGRASPEVGVSDGFVDYRLEANGRPILLELKPLFVPKRDEDGNLLELKQEALSWKNHKEQIENYTMKNEFLIFTDLKSWFFFSTRGRAEVINETPVELRDFFREFKRSVDLKDYLERIEEQSIRGGLDENFFDSLTSWVERLESAGFKEDVSEDEKIEAIINLINKFIFIQTLDDYSVIDFQWIQNKWLAKKRDWKGIGKEEILTEFLGEVNKWFYRYYDTELFRQSFLDKIKDEKETYENLFEKLELVLGLKQWQSVIGGEDRGIINYNYRRIDEDIFGRAYEEFLADIRKEEGIYYTRKYVTKYINESTVEKRFDDLLEKFENALEQEKYDEAENIIQKFVSQKILDPACGSGSFLIKSIRIIWQKYEKALEILSNMHDRYAKNKGTLDLPSDKLERINDLKEIIGEEGTLKRMSKVILRHIYGNDKDSRALSVAKVNIWLEAIKIIPTEFQYDKIQGGGGYVLPDLEMNLGHGDSLVGLSEKRTIEFLEEEHQEKFQELNKLRNHYLDNPHDEDAIEKVGDYLSELRSDLDEEFERYLEDNDLSTDVLEETIPFHWALQFWHVFDKESSGFDIVLGNPPYERIQNMKGTPHFLDYLNESYEVPHQNYDIAVVFTEKGYELLKNDGVFGYIETKKWMTANYGEKLREYLSSKRALSQIVDFGDQQAFKGPFGQSKGPTTYTILLFLQKSESNSFKYSNVKDLKHELEQLRKIENNEQLIEKDLSVDVKDYEGLNSDSWIFSLPEEKRILEKLSEYPKLDDLRDRIFQGLVTGADPVFILELLETGEDNITVFSKETEKEHLIEKEMLKPLLKGNEIDKWAIRGYQYVMLFPYDLKVSEDERNAFLMDISDLKENYPKAWSYLKENKERLEARENGKWEGKEDWYAFGRRQNIEQFEQTKIVTQVLASKSSLALDSDGFYYFVGGGNAGGYGITLKDSTEITYSYLLGLLNSSILEWRLKKESSQFRGGYYSYAKRYIEKLPIIYDSEKEERIVEIVEEAIDLSELRYRMEEEWPEVSKKLKNSERTLKRLLMRDKETLQTGNRRKAWTADVSFYPDSDDEKLEMNYPKFIFSGDSENLKISIYGIVGQEEEKIYEMEFREKDFMEIVYLSLKELFDSRKKVKKLNHILDKAVIPVIQPNIWENTGNLLRETKERVKELRGEEDLTDIESGIVEIEQRIKDLENELDSLVFGMYDMDREDVETVLNSLEIKQTEKNDILNRFTD